MQLRELLYLAFEFNAAVDTGNHDDITVTDVEAHIQEADLLPWLEQRLGEDIDLSLLDGPTVSEFTRNLENIRGAYQGDESRKWGIRNRGLCLLVAWTLELVQRPEQDSS